MATKLFLTLVNNVKTLVAAIVTSAGAGDANKIVATGDDGRLSSTLMPVGVGADTKSIIASEALAAGDYVSVFTNVGVPNVRKASAVDATRPAHGFVIDNVTLGASAIVFFEGPNTAVTGVVAGTQYVVSNTTPGAVEAVADFAPATGNIVQTVGVATDTTEINTEIGAFVTIG